MARIPLVRPPGDAELAAGLRPVPSTPALVASLRAAARPRFVVELPVEPLPNEIIQRVAAAAAKWGADPVVTTRFLLGEAATQPHLIGQVRVIKAAAERCGYTFRLEGS